MKQSFAAVAMGGVISVIGYVGGDEVENAATFMDCLVHNCIIRGLMVGSRAQLEDMVRAIDGNMIKPMLDTTTFRLEDLRQAYQVS